MATHTFQFGVELELLIGSKTPSSSSSSSKSQHKQHKSWKSLASDLSAQLAQAGIPNHLNEGQDKSPANYCEWSIAREVTIPAPAGKNLFGLELVSPAYTPTDTATGHPPWSSDLSIIFTTLHRNYVLHPSPHCSTHVHISAQPPLSPSPYSPSPRTHPSPLLSLAKSALYYEPHLDALFPPSRSSPHSYWCQSNRSSPSLRPLPSLSHCLSYLDSCDDLVRAMCLFPARSAYGRASGHADDFVHGGVYKWNFSGLSVPDEDGRGRGRGTLEFRQPPGSTTAEEAAAWVELAVCFVAGAIARGGGSLDPGARRVGGGGGSISNSSTSRIEELWWLLSAGAAQVPGFSELRGIERLLYAASQTGTGGKKTKTTSRKK
ncbi:putative amidoligase enzyme-domain-containing protein [Biscogniauxia mediterranea]|nr:putative amidoligase enzyme-domain-containing protein [Biscogniauxia mediterranea]